MMLLGLFSHRRMVLPSLLTPILVNCLEAAGVVVKIGLRVLLKAAMSPLGLTRLTDCPVNAVETPFTILNTPAQRSGAPETALPRKMATYCDVLYTLVTEVLVWEKPKVRPIPPLLLPGFQPATRTESCVKSRTLQSGE
jgi:hypothetical protein